MTFEDSYAAPSGLRHRLGRRGRGLRRVVLRHRRALAVVAVVVAVLNGLRATAPATPDTVAVSVLARSVSAGAVLTAADLSTVALPPESVPADLVADPIGRSVATGVARGEPLTSARLIGPQLDAGRGRRAVPVRLPDPATAALLHTGDRIDLVAVDPQGGAPRSVADDVPVLAVPQMAGGGDGAATLGGAPGLVVVLAVAEAEVSAVSDASVRLFLTWSWSGSGSH